MGKKKEKEKKEKKTWTGVTWIGDDFGPSGSFLVSFCCFSKQFACHLWSRSVASAIGLLHISQVGINSWLCYIIYVIYLFFEKKKKRISTS